MSRWGEKCVHACGWGVGLLFSDVEDSQPAHGWDQRVVVREP